MSVTRINEFQAAQGKAQELFEFLTSLLPYITSSEGCESCEVLRSKDVQESFLVIEKWDSVESHQNSIKCFPKEQMQSAMVLFGAPPKGSYYHA